MPAPIDGQAVHVQPGDKKWERVGPETQRMRVDGGWLYKVESYGGQVALQFVSAAEATDDYSSRRLLKEG